MDVVRKASLVLLICCTPWVFAAKIKTKVLVLGGGAAGIGFSKRLWDKGQTEFLVLETQSYIGGRMKHTAFGNLTIQAGAGWIHGIGKDNSLYLLKQKFGMAATRDDYNDFIVRDLKGSVVSGAKAIFNKLGADFEKMYTMNEKLTANGESDIPLRTALQLVGWDPKTPTEKTIDYYFNDFENESPPWVLSARNVGHTGEGTDEVVTDSRGFTYLLREEAKNFTSKVKLNTRVTKVTYDTTKVSVLTSNGDTYEADYAYMTFSTGVLLSSNVEFSPPLPDWKKKAAYMLPMGHYTKIFLKFPTKFWDANRYILVASDKRGHYIHFQNLDRSGLFPGQKMLVATVTGEESVRVEKLTDAQVKSEVMAVLKKVYPSATTATAIFVSRWSLDNTTYGSYSSPVVGADKYTYESLSAPLNKTLWFGGEAATDSENFGYAHGALSFGMKQADQLIACMADSSKCPAHKARPKPKVCSSAPTSYTQYLAITVLLMLLVKVLM